MNVSLLLVIREERKMIIDVEEMNIYKNHIAFLKREIFRLCRNAITRTTPVSQMHLLTNY